jgi:hypothetical protein
MGGSMPPGCCWSSGRTRMWLMRAGGPVSLSGGVRLRYLSTGPMCGEHQVVAFSAPPDGCHARLVDKRRHQDPSFLFPAALTFAARNGMDRHWSSVVSVVYDWRL